MTEHDFNAFITAINTSISPYDLEIRSTFHQTTRHRIYALVNLTSDAITQLATIHTPDEISYVKRLLDAMFDTYNTRKREIMAITSMQAVGLAKSSNDRRTTQNGSETQGSIGQGLTMRDAEKVLKNMVEEGWFEKSRKGFYSLTPRALMELRGWLMESYNYEGEDEEERVIKIKQCYACKEIVTTVGTPMRRLQELITDRCSRVNDAITKNALVVYTISAHNDFSICRKLGNAQYASRTGQAKILSEKELLWI